MKNKNRGFTLIELLIVIGIIAILAAAVIVAINPGRQFQQARNATRWSHMNSVMNAIYSYAITNQGNFPDCLPVETDNTKHATPNAPVDLYACNTVLTITDGGFINQLPEDPTEGGANYDWDGDNAGPDNESDPYWDHVDEEPFCNDGADCTGYIIGLVGENSNRVRIISAAEEAWEISVTQ